MSSGATKATRTPKPNRKVGNGAARKRSAARAKQVAPAAATGGAGNAFESRVQARRLFAMCTGSTSCPGIPDGFRIVALRFQARVHGNNTDDLVCSIEDKYGNTGSVRLQMKRTLQARLSNSAFKEAVGLAWLDFKTPSFRANADFFNIVYDVVSAPDMKPVSDLAREAVRSLTVESWEHKATAKTFSNEARRSALGALQSIVDEYNEAPVPKDELFRFMRHMQFLHEDLDSDETAGAKELQSIIELAARVQGREALSPSSVWARLVAVCVDLNGLAGEVDLTNVGTLLGSDLDYLFKAFSMSASLAGPLAAVVTADGSVALPQVPIAPAAAPSQTASSAGTDLIPSARDSSANKLVSRMLDRVSELIKACKFKDAKEELDRIRHDTADQTLDAHQHARWFAMHGSCVWTLGDGEQAAADDFIKAADLYEDDDNLAAARVRGLLLKSMVADAMAAAQNALRRFPDSLAVWVSWMNARIMDGEKVSEADIPAVHADKSAAYQMVAAGLRNAGDTDAALQVALIGLQKDDASFFLRDAVLRYALELATSSPVYVAYRVAPAPCLATLRRAVDAFSPREAKLWSAQVPETLTTAALHLSYAHLLLGEPSQALEITEEGERYQNDQAALVRPRMEALRDLGRSGDALAFGEPLLETMPFDALVFFAQTAADESDVERLARAVTVGEARANEDESGRLSETLKVLQWELLLRQGKEQDVAREATELGVLTSGSVPLLVQAARAFLQFRGNDSANAANEYIAKAVDAAQAHSDPANDYLVAQLMMQAKRYEEAAERYEKIVPSGTLSELHTNLLDCYIRLGLRAKARDLIASLPAHWRRDRLARQLAMELGQQAGDWAMLQTLVDPQLGEEGGYAKSWLFALMVAAHTTDGSIDELVAKFPPVLEGSIREVTQAASAEFQHNQLDKGLTRLYRMRRLNLGNADAAAALYTAIALSPVRLERLHEEPKVVGVGTSVQLADAAGVLRWTTIDPVGLDDLPPTEEFVRVDSPEAKALLGKQVGDKLVARDLLGGEHLFTVTAVLNAYARLMMLSNASLNAPVVPSEHLTAVQLSTKADGELDVEPVLRQLRKKEASTNRLFKHYQDQALTLGMLARVLGTDTLDLVRAWPDDGPLLQVGGGEVSERTRAYEQLRSGKRLLVDLSALTELALVKQLHLLGGRQRPLVTAATRDTVLEKLAEARILKPTGTMMSRGGRFHLIEYTDESRAREQAFLQTVVDAIAQYCEVVPAYGPTVVPVQLPQLAAVVSHEEHAIIMAALEHDAILLTLDMRLRGLASAFQVQSCWPQAFLASKLGPELSLRDYSSAALQMFCSRRDFITLNAHDLLVLTDQGEGWLNVGLARLRELLCSPSCDFGKGWAVIRQYLISLYGRGKCEVGAVLELYVYLLEGLLRHPQCPEGFGATAAVDLGMALGGEKDAFTDRLRIFSEMAVARLQRPMEPVQVRAKVVFCSNPPVVRHGLSDGPDPLGEVTSEPAAFHAQAGRTGTTLNRATEED